MGKKTLLTISGMVLVVIALLLIQQLAIRKQQSAPSNSVAQREYTLASATPTLALQKKEIAVIVDFGNGRRIEGAVSATNAYEALSTLTRARDIAITVKEYKFGVLVESIDDLKNTNVSAWSYSVNGKPGQIAADRQLVNSKDTVTWEYKRIN